MTPSRLAARGQAICGHCCEPRGQSERRRHSRAARLVHRQWHAGRRCLGQLRGGDPEAVLVFLFPLAAHNMFAKALCEQGVQTCPPPRLLDFLTGLSPNGHKLTNWTNWDSYHFRRSALLRGFCAPSLAGAAHGTRAQMATGPALQPDHESLAASGRARTGVPAEGLDLCLGLPLGQHRRPVAPDPSLSPGRPLWPRAWLTVRG